MTTRELASMLNALVAQGHGDKPIEVECGDGSTAFGVTVDGLGVSLDTTAEPGSLEIVTGRGLWRAP